MNRISSSPGRWLAAASPLRVSGAFASVGAAEAALTLILESFNVTR